MDSITNFIIALTGLVIALTTLAGGIVGGLKLLRGQRDIHTLVNSSFGQQLLLYATALQCTADTDQSPKAVAAAKAAWIVYQEHQARQSRVDATNRENR